MILRSKMMSAVFCALVAATSFSSTKAEFKPSKDVLAKYLVDNPVLCSSIMAAFAYGWFHTPSESEEGLVKSLEECIGWCKKEGKFKDSELDPANPVWKAGYKGQGLIGFIEENYKFVAAFVGLYLVLNKTADGLVDTTALCTGYSLPL